MRTLTLGLQLAALPSSLLLASCAHTFCGRFDIRADDTGHVYVWNRSTVTVLSSRLRTLKVYRLGTMGGYQSDAGFAITGRGTIAIVADSAANTALRIFAHGRSLQYLQRGADGPSDCCGLHPLPSITSEPHSHFVLGGEPQDVAASGEESLVLIADYKSPWELDLGQDGHLLHQRRLPAQLPEIAFADFASSRREAFFLAFQPDKARQMTGISMVNYRSGRHRWISVPRSVEEYGGIALDRSGHVFLSVVQRGIGNVLVFDVGKDGHAPPIREIPVPNSRDRSPGSIAVSSTGMLYVTTFLTGELHSEGELGEIVALDPHSGYSSVARVALPVVCQGME